MVDSDRTERFPVNWDDPADAELSWNQDMMHHPDTRTPLGFELYNEPSSRGRGVLMTEQNTPTQTRSVLVNYYMFGCQQSQSPAPSGATPSWSEQLAEMSSQADRWFNDLLPEVQRMAGYYRDTDFDALPDAELVTELEQLRKMRIQQGRMHSLATAPGGSATNLLVDTYNELMGEDELGAVRLVQGHGNKSAEAGVAMWRLGNLARSIPVVRDNITQVSADNALDRLEELKGDPKAKPFIDALGLYLEEFGWRTDLLGFDDPTWVEDPTTPICPLRFYLEMEDYGPAEETRRLVQERDSAIEAVRKRLGQAEWERLEAILKVATMAAPIQEDHNHYIDQRLTLLTRRLVLAAARRLVSKGALVEPADVFYLYLDEIRSAMSGNGSSMKALAGRRMGERACWSKITPPPFIGAPPSGHNPNIRFFGQSRLPSHQATTLSGTSASAGVARGPARVMMSLSQADELKKGDILIARTTMPPWTPLFAVAGAIVVETGGILSHAAVTAREYGIPAVMGIAGATRTIRDGQLLEVDGTEGTVRLLP